ncbi:hypothetical protein [Actinospongicola halichondriae]|uniref:hypothetical protein n=1 Tax=Actinospongicola halichondriae TaxID=3236844 RepID=UPI003D5A2221
MRVDTPGGTWHVRRRWAPRHLGADTIFGRFWKRTRTVRRRTTELGDIPDPGCAPDIGEAIVVFIVVVLVVLFLIFIGIPFLIALGELLLILVFALAGLIGRVLFRRPWTVDAVSPDGEHTTWSIVGWRTSATARQFIADRLAAGGGVPTTTEVDAAVLAS